LDTPRRTGLEAFESVGRNEIFRDHIHTHGRMAGVAMDYLKHC
jgi:hypothetical protein